MAWAATKTEAAYRREISSIWRRKLMMAWQAYCGAKQEGKASWRTEAEGLPEGIGWSGSADYGVNRGPLLDIYDSYAMVWIFRARRSHLERSDLAPEI